MSIVGIPIGGLAPTTFLSLVQRTAQECGVSKDPATAIPTLAGATGEVARMANWVQSAWFDIQGLHGDWKFQRRSVSFVTVSGQATYTPVEAGLLLDTLERWEVESFRSYLTTATQNAEQFMTPMDYETWRNLYQLGVARTTLSQPVVLTVTPDNALGLGPVPPAGYTVLGDYYLQPVMLNTDLDTPGLPARHNKMIIVYKAMLDYGGFEAAGEVYQRADMNYHRLLSRLENEQLPPVTWEATL